MRHLHRVHTAYSEYYNQVRPHQGNGQRFPISGPGRSTVGPIHKRNALGGMLSDDYRQPLDLVAGCKFFLLGTGGNHPICTQESRVRRETLGRFQRSLDPNMEFRNVQEPFLIL